MTQSNKSRKFHSEFELSEYLNEGNDSELSELDELEEDYQHEDNVVTDNLSHEANETPGLQLDVLHEEETLPSEEAAVEN